MSASPTRVALIGAGRMGREHARAFADLRDVALVGIQSRTRSRAEQLAAEFRIGRVCKDVDELATETRPDLVVVAVPELAAHDVAMACFRHDWTVLLEKPAGHTLDEARRIEAEARRRNARAFVALNRRYLSVTRQVRRDLAGTPGHRWVRVQDQQDLERAKELGHPAPVLANWMFANAIHLIDYFRTMGHGGIRGVEPVLPWDPKNPGIVVAHLTYESGDTGLYECVWNRPGPWSVAVTTPRTRWELRPLEQGVVQELGQGPRPLAVHPHDQAFKPGFRAQAEDAVAAARGQPHTLPSLADGLATMELIGRIYSQSPTRLTIPTAATAATPTA